MKRVKLIVATHGRHECLSRMLQGLDETVEQFGKLGIDLIPVFGGSPDDAKLVRSHGYNFYELPNNPLGRKMNLLMKCDTQDYDYLMQLGSDDVITSEGVLALASWMHQGAKFFGFNKLAFVDMPTGRVKIGHYKMVFGAGRCIRRDVVMKCLPLWSDNQKRGLDGNSQGAIMRGANTGPRVITMYRPAIWDLKDSDSLNKWDKMINGVETNDYVVPEVLQGVVNPPSYE